MKKLVKMNAYMISQAVIHPRTQLVYYGNPSTVKMSPVPWWGSGIAFVLGVATWIVAAKCCIPELTEPARAMVYGSIFTLTGINIGIRQAQVSKGIKC